MGTNFYLRRVAGRTVHDRMHIAKQSAGWVVHFQDSSAGWADPAEDEPEQPRFRSVAEIRALLEGGEWQLADEYDRVWPPGEESLRAFDGLCRWRGGPQFEGREALPYGQRHRCPGHRGPWENDVLGSDYRDEEGYVFTPTDFR